jgi:hypothetical protein
MAFPVGTSVRIQNTSCENLDGSVGTVMGFYGVDCVIVKFNHVPVGYLPAIVITEHCLIECDPIEKDECDGVMEHLSECCELLRGPTTVVMKSKTNSCTLNSLLDGVPLFAPIEIKNGERDVAMYQCHDVPGYSEVFITVVARK